MMLFIGIMIGAVLGFVIAALVRANEYDEGGHPL